MRSPEEVSIDVRDLDYSWYEAVRAYLDRNYDLYYLPLESVERLGEPDEENGNYYLTAANIEAEADELEIDGHAMPVWSVGCAQLIVRPARATA